MKRKSLPPPRLDPPTMRFVIGCSFFRRPTLKERIAILFGYNIRIQLKVASQHNPGKFEAHLDLQTTKEIQPTVQ